MPSADTAGAHPVPDGGAPAIRPFKFVGGDPSLDFVNTVAWADDGPAPTRAHDRFVDYAAVTRWAEAAGVVRPDVAGALRHRAAAHPAAAAQALQGALDLRALLKRVYTAAGRPGWGTGSAPELDALNAAVAAAVGRRVLAPGDGAGLRWAWRGWGEELECVLWPVVHAAAELLTSGPRHPIRVCDGPGCGWVYADTSHNGLRR